MGTPRKVDVLIAQFTYSANGAVAMVLPHFVPWIAGLTSQLNKDERIGRVALRQYGDCPLTMERNRVVRDAIAGGFDLILMLDSDNQPDVDLGKDVRARPFWESSFEFLYPRLCRDIPTVVFAPYCGPPPIENVFVFHWEDHETNTVRPTFKLEAYSRTHADQMAGIQPCAAGPTGVILYTTSAFDLMRFDKRPVSEILADYKAGHIDAEQCQRQIQMQSYFWYEFTDQWQTTKASTEDVTNTREIGMAGQLKYGEDVLFCNWDAWAGHFKQKCVGRPRLVRVEDVNAVYREAVAMNLKTGEQIVDVDFASSAPQVNVAEQPAEVSPVGVPLADGYNVSVPLIQRMVCGRKVTSVGHITPDHELEALTVLSRNIGRAVSGRPLRMLEVGSWVGESAIALLGGAPEGSEIYCVDTWEGSAGDWTGDIATVEPPAKWFVENCGDLVGTTVKPYRGESVQVADDLGDDQQLDLIFIDAEHTYEAVTADLNAWYRHVAVNGVLCGHDYRIQQFPGVTRAVDDFVAARNGLLGKLVVVPSTSLWFIRKTESANGITDNHATY